jgi:hypothetical protein
MHQPSPLYTLLNKVKCEECTKLVQKEDIKKMEEKGIHIRIDLYPGKPGYKKFCDIKEELGVHNNIEVLRSVLGKYHLKRRKSDE